jgi:mannose-6-phosphate isomerase
VRLKPDNFTPPSRTPWGGTRLAGGYKAALAVGGAAPGGKVGESWELSIGEEFPSVTDGGVFLSEMIAKDAAAWLGANVGRAQPSAALLVKWLDAGDNLSLQIHPEDSYSALGAAEGGKTEGWYVVARDPGAGIYLGFQPGVDARAVRSVLDDDGDLSVLMTFMPVEPGDFILLEPGTPHAVGRGITLIEPQIVRPGARAVTYRYWDFGRRYDPTGQLDAAGQPRPLHLDHALAVTRWERACDPTWLASRRASLGWPTTGRAGDCQLLCGREPEAAIHSTSLGVARLCGTGRVALPAWNALRSLTVVEGSAVLGHGPEPLTVPTGTTAAIPACAGSLSIELSAAHVVVAAALG